MTNRIVMLDELTINKIAAGEVVESPSSVVKELVENSIDANATRITIEISEGGKESIRISDDGDGILPEDIELAFQRHSTSKIKSIDDFNYLHSNGFRGEALSSIASVAKVEMLTNTTESGLGKKVNVENGNIVSNKDIGVKKGTIINVYNIFYNTPARQKFLKTTSSETGKISDILGRMAVINNQISMKYISNKKEIFNTVGDGQMLSSISAVYGKTLSASLIPIFYSNHQITIQGYISKTSLYQSNRRKENIFVNKRYLKTNALYYVVENIYKGLIPIGKYPVFFLDITIDPQYVDPNVHPSKLEIKISSQLDIGTPLGESIRGALFESSRNLIPEAKIRPSTFEIQNSGSDFSDSTQNVSTSTNNFEYQEIIIEKDNPGTNEEVIKHIELNEIQQNYQLDFVKPLIAEPVEIPAPIEQKSFFQDEKIFDYTSLQFIGIVFNTYIIVSLRDSLYLIDQHAAHERILYEKILKDLDLHGENTHFQSQELLVAEIQEFGAFEYERILENMDFFINLGFEVDDFGFNRIAIRTVPILLGKVQGIDFFNGLVEIVLEEKSLDLNHKFNDKIAKMACKKAIKANQRIGPDEVNLLFQQLNLCDNKYTCPHGRPIFIEISKYELEKKFKRIQ